MAKRKRLNPLEIGDGAARAPETKSMGMPPIARVAGESAGGGERALAMADEAGRLLHAIPLDRIDMFHLNRDRIKPSEEGMEALKTSIAAHGQRVPIEVMAVAVPDGEAEFPFGLISGYRRLAALRALAQAHPNDPRFATVKAFIRKPDDLGAAYVTMVEENEIREDVSHFERARVALLAARAGAFDSVEQAVDVLYAAGSKARRSKIRSFVSVVETLGGSLVFPTAVGERLGLRLAEAIRDGRGARLVTALDTGDYEDAAGQNATLEAVLKDKVSRAKSVAGRAVAGARVSRAKPLFSHDLPGGIRAELHREGAVSRLEITGHELTPHQAQMLAGASS